MTNFISNGKETDRHHEIILSLLKHPGCWEGDFLFINLYAALE